MTPATAAITDALPPSLQNVGSAVNDLSRELGVPWASRSWGAP